MHVLFTDIHMLGGINGIELAHHTHGHWPWIGVLIASAQAQPIPAELPTGSRFLAKPYQCDHLVNHIRELVAAPS